MKPVRTWVLIADGARARILENAGPGRGLVAVPDTDMRFDIPQNRDILADKPGRSFESRGATRHAVESPSDPHRELKRKFAETIAALVENKHREQAFDRLVVVAPAVTMGDLRKALPEQIKKTVIGEIVEDLTKVPNDRVGKHLASVLIV